MAKNAGTLRRRRAPRFAEILSKYVEEMGGAAAVANEVGASIHTLQAWMTSRREPSLWWLQVLAIYFDSTPNNLLGVRKDPYADADILGVGKRVHFWRSDQEAWFKEVQRLSKEEENAKYREKQIVKKRTAAADHRAAERARGKALFEANQSELRDKNSPEALPVREACGE
jgi:hypothetical protein